MGGCERNAGHSGCWAPVRSVKVIQKACAWKTTGQKWADYDRFRFMRFMFHVQTSSPCLAKVQDQPVPVQQMSLLALGQSTGLTSLPFPEKSFGAMGHVLNNKNCIPTTANAHSRNWKLTESKVKSGAKVCENQWDPKNAVNKFSPPCWRPRARD